MTWCAESGAFGDIEDMVALSPTDIWAVGSHIVHFDGTMWKATEPWPDSALLTGIDIRADVGWIVGHAGRRFRLQAGQWTELPGIAGVEFEGIGLDADGLGWAVGYSAGRGVVFRVAGDTWTALPEAWDERLHDITVLPDGEAWVVGDRGTVLYERDGRWGQVPVDTTDDLRGVFASAVNNLWLVGGLDSGSVSTQVALHFDGTTWKVVVQRRGRLPLFDVYAAEDRAWFVGDGGTVLFYDGSSLTELPAIDDGGDDTSVQVVTVVPGSGDVLCATRRGFIARLLIDAWERRRFGRWLTGVVVFEGGEGWAVGPGGPALHRTAGAWRPVSSPPELIGLRDLDGRTTNDLWGVMGDGTLVHGVNGVWTGGIRGSSSVPLEHVRVASSGDAWAIGGRESSPDVWVSEITAYDSSSMAWDVTLRSVDKSRTIRDVDGSSASDAWAVGERSVWHFDGTAWSKTDVSASLYSVDVVGTDDVWASGAGTVLHYDGRLWTQSLGREILGGTVLETIRMNQDGTGWTAGDEGVILYYRSGEWRYIRRPGDILARGHVPSTVTDLAAIIDDNQEHLWAVGSEESILSWVGDPANLPMATATPSPTVYRPPVTPRPTHTPVVTPTAAPLWLPWMSTSGQ